MNDNTLTFLFSTGGVFLLIGIISLGMWGCPKYNVWQSKIAVEAARNNGEAELERARQNRIIQVEEAKANLEAQKLNSEAEVERAKGMAKSIEIENGKLTDKYIQYLWVRNIDKMNGEKIYIPTEAQLPILEAKNK